MVNDTMSIIQDISHGHAPPPGRMNVPLCLNKSWVENSNSQWPAWTESHLVFLIRKLNLCSVSSNKITHSSVAEIVQVTHIYTDQAGWDSTHLDRFWQKTNLKIGYLHAYLTGLVNRAFVEKCCPNRLQIHSQQKAALESVSLRQSHVSQISTSYRPPFTATPKPAFPTQPLHNHVPSQNFYEGMFPDLWKWMSSSDQAKLFQCQIKTSKDFNALATIMSQRCKAIRLRAASQQAKAAHASSAIDTRPTTTHPVKSALRLQANLSPSTVSYSQSLVNPNSREGSSPPLVRFDGLPSPTKSPEEKWITVSFSPKPSDTSHSTNAVEVIHEQKLANNTAYKHAQCLNVPKKLDVRATIQNKIRELELEREEQEAAEDTSEQRVEETDRRKRRRILVEI